MLKGGENGPAIVPGDPDKSLLIKAVRYEDPDLQMPPQGKKLSDEQIADLTAWVKMGAPDPRVLAKGAAAGGGVWSKERRDHWAFKPIEAAQFRRSGTPIGSQLRSMPSFWPGWKRRA